MQEIVSPIKPPLSTKSKRSVPNVFKANVLKYSWKPYKKIHSAFKSRLQNGNPQRLDSEDDDQILVNKPGALRKTTGDDLQAPVGTKPYFRSKTATAIATTRQKNHNSNNKESDYIQTKQPKARMSFLKIESGTKGTHVDSKTSAFGLGADLLLDRIPPAPAPAEPILDHNSKQQQATIVESGFTSPTVVYKKSRNWGRDTPTLDDPDDQYFIYPAGRKIGRSKSKPQYQQQPRIRESKKLILYQTNLQNKIRSTSRAKLDVPSKFIKTKTHPSFNKKGNEGVVSGSESETQYSHKSFKRNKNREIPKNRFQQQQRPSRVTEAVTESDPEPERERVAPPGTQQKTDSKPKIYSEISAQETMWYPTPEKPFVLKTSFGTSDSDVRINRNTAFQPKIVYSGSRKDLDHNLPAQTLMNANLRHSNTISNAIKNGITIPVSASASTGGRDSHYGSGSNSDSANVNAGGQKLKQIEKKIDNNSRQQSILMKPIKNSSTQADLIYTIAPTPPVINPSPVRTPNQNLLSLSPARSPTPNQNLSPKRKQISEPDHKAEKPKPYKTEKIKSQGYGQRPRRPSIRNFKVKSKIPPTPTPTAIPGPMDENIESTPPTAESVGAGHQEVNSNPNNSNTVPPIVDNNKDKDSSPSGPSPSAHSPVIVKKFAPIKSKPVPAILPVKQEIINKRRVSNENNPKNATTAVVALSQSKKQISVSSNNRNASASPALESPTATTGAVSTPNPNTPKKSYYSPNNNTKTRHQKQQLMEFHPTTTSTKLSPPRTVKSQKGVDVPLRTKSSVSTKSKSNKIDSAGTASKTTVASMTNNKKPTKAQQVTIIGELAKLQKSKLPILWLFGYTLSSIVGNVDKILTALSSHLNLYLIDLDKEIKKWTESPIFQQQQRMQFEGNIDDERDQDRDRDGASAFNQLTENSSTKTTDKYKSKSKAIFNDDIIIQATKILTKVIGMVNTVLETDDILELFTLAMIRAQVEEDPKPKGYIIKNFPLYTAEGEAFENYLYEVTTGLFIQPENEIDRVGHYNKVQMQEYFTREKEYSDAGVREAVDKFGGKYPIQIFVSTDDTSPIRDGKIQEIIYLVQSRMQMLQQIQGSKTSNMVTVTTPTGLQPLASGLGDWGINITGGSGNLGWKKEGKGSKVSRRVNQRSKEGDEGSATGSGGSGLSSAPARKVKARKVTN